MSSFHGISRRYIWDVAEYPYYSGALISGVSFKRSSTCCHNGPEIKNSSTPVSLLGASVPVAADEETDLLSELLSL